MSCCNGVWRVQDSLAVSRAIGDINMKQWIISEPETKKLQLTRDCEFLIMASDGLWDKVIHTRVLHRDYLFVHVCVLSFRKNFKRSFMTQHLHILLLCNLKCKEKQLKRIDDTCMSSSKFYVYVFSFN